MAVEMWKSFYKPQGRITNLPPDEFDGYEETFGFGPSQEPNAYSDVVLRGLGYKGCAVFLTSGENHHDRREEFWKER